MYILQYARTLILDADISIQVPILFRVFVHTSFRLYTCIFVCLFVCIASDRKEMTTMSVASLNLFHNPCDDNFPSNKKLKFLTPVLEFIFENQTS